MMWIWTHWSGCTGDKVANDHGLTSKSWLVYCHSFLLLLCGVPLWLLLTWYLILDKLIQRRHSNIGDPISRSPFKFKISGPCCYQNWALSFTRWVRWRCCVYHIKVSGCGTCINYFVFKVVRQTLIHLMLGSGCAIAHCISSQLYLCRGPCWITTRGEHCVFWG